MRFVRCSAYWARLLSTLIEHAYWARLLSALHKVFAYWARFVRRALSSDSCMSCGMTTSYPVRVTLCQVPCGMTTSYLIHVTSRWVPCGTTASYPVHVALRQVVVYLIWSPYLISLSGHTTGWGMYDNWCVTSMGLWTASGSRASKTTYIPTMTTRIVYDDLHCVWQPVTVYDDLCVTSMTTLQEDKYDDQ
jgi:hypothetical protein